MHRLDYPTSVHYPSGPDPPVAHGTAARPMTWTPVPNPGRNPPTGRPPEHSGLNIPEGLARWWLPEGARSARHGSTPQRARQTPQKMLKELISGALQDADRRLGSRAEPTHSARATPRARPPTSCTRGQCVRRTPESAQRTGKWRCGRGRTPWACRCPSPALSTRAHSGCT